MTKTLFIPNRKDYDLPCKGKNQNEEPCQKHALPGYRVCHWHGAGSPFEGKPRMYNMRLATPSRRSKMFVLSLAAKYEDAINDKELMNLREDLALIEVRIGQLLERAAHSENPARWQDLKMRCHELLVAARGGADVDAEVAAREIDKIFAQVDQDYAIWNEIEQIQELRRRVAESEVKRLVAMQQMIKAEDAMKLVAQVLAAVKKHIGKPPELAYAAIAYEFAIITGDANRCVPVGGEQEDNPDRPSGLDKKELLDTRDEGANPLS